MPCAKNPSLKVFSANGLFDLATPFFIHRVRSGAHGAGAQLRGNIEVRYYPSGHMIYLNVDALSNEERLAGFYTRAVEGSRLPVNDPPMRPEPGIESQCGQEYMISS